MTQNWKLKIRDPPGNSREERSLKVNIFAEKQIIGQFVVEIIRLFSNGYSGTESRQKRKSEITFLSLEGSLVQKIDLRQKN